MSFLINPYAFLAAGGDFEAISTYTVTGGNPVTVTLGSIPQTYKHLQVRALLKTQSEGNLQVKINNQPSDNRSHWLRGDGASASAGTDSTSGWIYCGWASLFQFGATVLDILDYADTSKRTVIRSFSGMDRNGNGSVGLWSGSNYTSTTAVTSLVFSGPSTGYFQTGSHFALYGVKA